MLNFFYEEKYGFKYESVARNFKFINSGSDVIVIHQFSNIVYVPFDSEQGRREYASR